MAIPAEQGLVKHYTVTIPAGSDQVDLYYTLDGTEDSTDLSPQLQGQGIGVYVQNASGPNVWVNVYTNVKIYGEEFRSYVNRFRVYAGRDAGAVIGFGQMKRKVHLKIVAEGGPVDSDVELVVAIVPSNG